MQRSSLFPCVLWLWRLTRYGILGGRDPVPVLEKSNSGVGSRVLGMGSTRISRRLVLSRGGSGFYWKPQPKIQSYYNCIFDVLRKAFFSLFCLPKLPSKPNRNHIWLCFVGSRVKKLYLCFVCVGGLFPVLRCVWGLWLLRIALASRLHFAEVLIFFCTY